MSTELQELAMSTASNSGTVIATPQVARCREGMAGCVIQPAPRYLAGEATEQSPEKKTV
jgi:hypothetical protein